MLKTSSTILIKHTCSLIHLYTQDSILRSVSCKLGLHMCKHGQKFSCWLSRHRHTKNVDLKPHFYYFVLCSEQCYPHFHTDNIAE